MANAINIKYSNKTSHTDFEVMVFTKNYSTRSPKTYYVAWQVLRGQTAVYFKYPLDTLEVGATYQESGLRIVSGPFHADVGSSWRITQPRPTDTALLLPITGIAGNPDGTIVIESKAPSAWNGRKFDVGIYKDGKLLVTQKDVHVGNQVDFLLQPRLFFAVVRNVTIGDIFTTLEITSCMTEFDLSQFPHGMEVTLNEAPGGGQYSFHAVNKSV